MESCWVSTLLTRHPKPRRMGINCPRPQTLGRNSPRQLLRILDKGRETDFCKCLSLWQLQPGVATSGFSSKFEARWLSVHTQECSCVERKQSPGLASPEIKKWWSWGQRPEATMKEKLIHIKSCRSRRNSTATERSTSDSPDLTSRTGETHKQGSMPPSRVPSKEKT